jgi:hypothetical protein
MSADDHDGAARLRERVGQAAAALMQMPAAGTTHSRSLGVAAVGRRPESVAILVR